MQLNLHDPRAEETADALCKLFQQFRVEEDIKPSAGFYSRVLDEIAVERQSLWFPLIYGPRTLQVAPVCVFLLRSTLLVLIGMERTEPFDYDSMIVELTSDRADIKRNAVLLLFLTDSPVHSQTR